ncbi:MAG: MBL fold metallo-hydrolase [Candidatus Eisenbacteria bacterium]
MATRKQAAKKPVANRRSPAGAGVGRVRVRMYRQGLGDCFLLSFGTGGSKRHVLIDCGTLGATTTGVKLSEVVDDIVAETGGKLDLLIATHEHHDHVSGFNSQKPKFDRLQVKRVWMAWTEDPADKLAQKIARTKQDLGAALAAAMPALRAAAPGSGAALAGDVVSGMLGWFGTDEALGADKFRETVDAAMDYVRTKAGAEVEFLKPGEVREESWLPGFRVYVLGPPRSEQALQDTGEQGSADLYSLAIGLRSAAEFSQVSEPYASYAMGDGGHAARSRFDSQLPFDPRHRCELNDSVARDRLLRSYEAKDVQWRRIDGDWLDSASDLALQLDSLTNNTSLALAIERVSDGKVLLFPADAQQGSWRSWHGASMEWKTSDLLERTVFYKVGHHGSHNATASAKGLELMKARQELVAFVPVDRAVALTRNPQGSWRMPARALYRRLLEQCEGRVLRSDIGWAADAAKAASKQTEKEFAALASPAEWKTWAAEQARAEKSMGVEVAEKWVDWVLG